MDTMFERIPDYRLEPDCETERDREWRRQIERDAVRDIIDRIELNWDEHDRAATMEYVANLLDEIKEEYNV